MEKSNSKGGLVIGILIGIIIMLVVFIGLFATNTISFSNETTAGEQSTSNESDKAGKNDNFTELDAKNILNDRIEKVFKYVHSLGAYCGETESSYPSDVNNYDKEKYIVEGFITYFASKYNSKEELNNYMKTFMNDDVIKKYSKEGVYTSPTYKEQNGKLFCLNSNKDCGMIYDADKSNLLISDYSNEKIVANGKLSFHSCGEEEEYLDVSVEIVKDSNNNWVINKYEESK